jgi:hypothetical protein
MTDTARLGLPLLAAGQAQKHVTHNEALALLDALVQMRLEAVDVNDPPEAPAEGEAHGVGPAPSGAWSGRAGAVAVRSGGAWTFLTPAEGWTAWDAGTGRLLVRTGSGWRSLDALLKRLGDLDALAIGTALDPNNPLSVKARSALFSSPGTEGEDGSLRVAFNRGAASGAATHLFQSDWSGRAETGLAGDDRWRLKVSVDGSLWRDAIVADPARGSVRIDALTSGRDGPGFGGRIEIGHTATRVGIVFLDASPSAEPGAAVVFRRGDAVAGSITTTAAGTVYGTVSDVRLKRDVAPITDALERLALLKPCRFAFRDAPERRLDGFLAHEAARAVPEAVTGAPDAEDEAEAPVPMTLDLARLVPLLTASVQKLAAKVEALERNRDRRAECAPAPPGPSEST